MAGRIPKPTALKVVAGNPGKRAINKQEPDPVYLQDLAAPAWMHASAKAVWDEVAPQLSRAKLLTEVDVQALSMGCVAVAQYRQSVRVAGDDLVKGKVVDSDNGEPEQAGEHLNPWMIVQSMSFKQAMAIFQQFGMTPASRTRIAIQPQGDLFGNGSEAQGAGRFFT